MPKIIVDMSEWAPSKICGYCGKQFYPIADEGFCNRICRDAHQDYGEWLYEMMLEEWLKSEGDL